MIKVCVDCIDETDFINHLIHAYWNGLKVECIVDWRKMTLTNSDNYVRFKRSGIDLLGGFLHAEGSADRGRAGHAQQVHHLRRRGCHDRFVQHHVRPVVGELGIRHDVSVAGRLYASRAKLLVERRGHDVKHILTWGGERFATFAALQRATEQRAMR